MNVYQDAHWRITRRGPHAWDIVGTPDGAFPNVTEQLPTRDAAMARIIALWAEYAGYLNQIIGDLQEQRDALQDAATIRAARGDR